MKKRWRGVVIDPVLPTYNRVNLVFERGEGAWLFTRDGQRYLDFTAGIAVNVLGHAHPHLVAALTEQAGKLWHISNVFRIEGGERLANRLIEATFADTMFFTNSGAEALECAIKMARRYHFASGHPERNRIIAFNGAFHGRTLATIAAAGNAKYLEGFGPDMPGFDHVPFGDLEAVKAAITPETAGILIEPVQGEGGVRSASWSFLRELRDLCDAHGILLMLDEVQCGVGRTGRFFAHEWAGITPDIMAVAKGIGGGFPVGACLATEEAAKGMTAGTHGSTYGGNPLAMSVANAVLDVVLADGFMEQVQATAGRLRQKLAELKDSHPQVIAEIRGEGLLLGLRTHVPNTDLIAALREEGMLVPGASDNVVRLLPPLTIGDEEIEAAFTRLDAACTKIESGLKVAAVKGAAA
ncbi:aspartate aminotransferase family protein [Ancylobacter radicis]|uniref:Acetylornithine aminotransferase n=1 Tax=Ancylobacter radicis TaxID=2836179 RepID=A0ABS5R4Z6_9HYPH|nr:aspartate aminotransferase family protein [Ancylobacter radicis]MBS9476728.1 aspartate aminotransferase family protein [Ancylobacter radicis]